MAGHHNWARSLIGGAVVISLAVVLAGCNWTMSGFDATHSGYNPVETAIGTSNVGALARTAVTVPSAGAGPITSSPTIMNDVLYVSSNDARGGTLTAYAADGSTNCSTYTQPAPQTCRPLWRATPGGVTHWLNSTPAVDPAAGIVYVGSADGMLYAYDAKGVTNCVASGATKVCNPLWQSDQLYGSIDSSPTIADGYVYVSTVYGWMYMFDETTGYDGSNPSCKTTSVGNRVCHWEWQDRTPGNVFSAPAVANGLVYTASSAVGGGTLWAFDATTDGSPNCSGTAYVDKTCDARWTASWGDGRSSPVIANGLVYIGSLEDGLLAFEADGSTNCSGTAYVDRTCAPLWTAATGRQAGASPVVANGLVYIGARDGTLYAFDATSGDQRWTAATGGSIDSSAVVAGGVIYVGCSDQAQGQVCCGSLFAFNATNGARLWTGGTGGSIDEPPTVLDEPMVVRSNNRGGLRFLLGAVYVGSGSQVSQFALP